MEMSEEGKLDGVGHLDWGDSETMIDLIEEIGHRSSDLGDLLAEGPERIADAKDAHGNKLSVKGQTMAAYDPRCMKGMGIAYATSNRGAHHLRGYTPAAEILGIPEKVDPYEWEVRASSPPPSRTYTPSPTPSTSASSARSRRDRRVRAPVQRHDRSRRHRGRAVRGRRARVQPRTLLQQPRRLRRRGRHAAEPLHRRAPGRHPRHGRQRGRARRARRDEGGVLRDPRLGRRRRPGREARGARHRHRPRYRCLRRRLRSPADD